MDAGATPILGRSGAPNRSSRSRSAAAARAASPISPSLEALDELGVAPAAIAGTSIGAVIGAAYAAGMRGARHPRLCARRTAQSLRSDGQAAARAGRPLLRPRPARPRQSGAARRRDLPRPVLAGGGARLLRGACRRRCWSWRPTSMIAASSSCRAARSRQRSPDRWRFPV